MSFISPEFAFVALVFFPLFWGLHAQRTLQLWVLAISSYLLYATWSETGAAILFAYTIAIWMGGTLLNRLPPEQKGRGLLAALVITAGTSLLVLTKYYNFLRQILVDTLPELGMQHSLPILDLVIPAGVSFFTFQAITYLVWRYKTPRQSASFLHTLVFLSFWPTLFAGPILRAEAFFAALEEEDFGLPREVPRALYLILLGMAQKLVFSSWLADNFVDATFKYPENFDGLQVGAAIWAYSLQIFMDFSGYSLIVTGLGLLLGYRIPMNFAQPYLARNLREFWHRWHITLSTFIRDYVYIPLGGSRVGAFRTQFNLMLAMVISGIWHGANTTFVIWGALHGLGMLLINAFGRLGMGKFPRLISLPITLVYVAFAWVFFRSDSLDAALGMLEQLSVPVTAWHANIGLLALFSLVFFLLSAYAETFERWAVELFERTWGWRLVIVVSVISFIVVQLCPSGIPSFIYYRF